MTQEQKIIRAKFGLLELAKQLGNVSQACEMMLTLGSSLAAVIAVISQAVVSECVPVAQRGAVLAIGTAFMTSAGVLAPYVMGDIVEKAATPVEGFFRGYTIIGEIMFTGGLIAMLFVRPEREAERVCQNAMRVPLPAPGLAR